MKRPLLLIGLTLAALLANVLAQNQVQIQFERDPLLVLTGSEIVFTVLTVSEILSMTWEYEGETLGLFAGGQPTVNPVPQFLGRVSISANQLRIGGAQLGDAGTYTVEVIPSATTGLDPNDRSIQLRVFDAVDGVTLVFSTIAVEGRNLSLTCSATSGTDITFQWGKGGVAITNDSRITISGGLLVINPVRRGDAGDYTCTVSNPVSAQANTESLTVFYGPDTPVLTTDTQKDCVGEGDVQVGQTVRLTCISDSLPPALFSWTLDGQPVASGQPDSGVLSVQTFSSDEGGRYVCTARNTVTEGTSEQGTVLTVVDVCLSGGEVAGIVIGCVVLLIILGLLIGLLIFLVRRRREMRQDPLLVPRVKTNPRFRPPDPQPNGARDLDQVPNPPLHLLNTHIHQPARSYTGPRDPNPQMLQMNGLQNSNTHQPNGQAHANGLLHNSMQNTESQLRNGVDNSAFVHTDAQNANAVPNTQQQNPNIVIQAGAPEGGAQPQAVHVSLNTLPQSGNAQMPAIHFNLNSYPSNGQRTQQDGSFPLTNNNIFETQQNVMQAAQSNPRMQSVQPYHSDPWWNGQVETVQQAQPDLIPTGFTHFNRNNISHRNARTQTDQQQLERQGRSDRNPDRHDTRGSSARRQMPWDLVRATPAFPSGTLRRREGASDVTYDATDYTTHAPVREERTPNLRSEARTRSQTEPRRRTPPRRDDSSLDRRARSPSDSPRIQNIRGVKLLDAAHHNQRTPPTRTKNVHQDSRGLSGSQNPLRQEATQNYSPQARPLTTPQASVGISAVPQGPVTQQGPVLLQSTDTRALVDPNHLPQAFMSQQHRAAPVQQPPQGLGTQTRPVTRDGNQPRQGGTGPVPHAAAQPGPGNLTQDAVQAHTERARVFQSRRQQTQAALLHPGPPADKHPPTPPPVIPLAQFQTLPKKSTQHKSPARAPVNMPVGQRPHQARHQPNVHHAAAPGNHHHHHHHHGNGTAHRHAHAHGQAHFTQPRQQQAHRGRPR